MSSRYAAFRRQPVDPQYAQQLQMTVLPAPTRGLILNENEAFMQPGGAIVQDNWFPTLQGVKLRGGCERWCDLHSLDATVPPIPSASRLPVISAFEYSDGNTQKMFAANANKLFDVTAPGGPVLVRSGHASGNYCASQLTNASGTNFLIAVNEAGDYPMRLDSSTFTWTELNGGQITGPAGSPVVAGHGLSYVWKYRNRWFFVGVGSMDAWYLPLNSVQGALNQIPLAGAFTRGGKLIAGMTWSIDAGDGIDDKCVFLTDLGEVAIFTGSNPADPANWRQEGRYRISPPMGMNAHISVGGDLLIACVDGIIPLSQAITKDPGQLDLAMPTRVIETMWRNEANAKRSWAWTFSKWDEYDGLFITWPGGDPGNRYCAVSNTTTGAWCRFVGWDATCWIRMRGDMFFGTQDGLIQQADRTGYDDGAIYTATLVGGWEMFGSPASEIVWHQARASFKSSAFEPFYPQLSATVDYLIVIPTPPSPGPDPGIQDAWDEGLWGPSGSGDLDPPPPADITQYAQWDQPVTSIFPARNTMWVSIGMTGFAHAPIVQVTVAQQAKPNVELIALAATFERAGVNV